MLLPSASRRRFALSLGEAPAYRSAVEMIERFPNVVVARTFSKIYGMAGMRLGYAVASKAGAAALRRCGPRRPGATRTWPSSPRPRPASPTRVMIETGADVKPVIAAFEARGIRVGRRFAAMPTWLRVTIGTREETHVFLAAFRAIAPARAAAA